MDSLRLPSAVLEMGLGAALLLFASAPAARAQDTPAPAHISFVDGSASLDRDGQAQAAMAGLPFLAGDRVRTTGSRVEVLFPDGSALDIDEHTSVELQSTTLLRVTSGRIILIVSGADDPGRALRYQIDTPVASANTEGPGEYRVALFSSPNGVETELAVLRGSAVLRTERGSVPIRAGERSLARDLEAPSFPQTFNSARFDAFDLWAAARRDARLGTAASARYLPRDLHMYSGVLDRYGAWQYEVPYGYVWYPMVAPGWRPYYHGYWAALQPYGWTWIGLDYWGWPTHHYGRWGFAHSQWFWIPHRLWAPAWVSWGAALDYVTWCPLGFDNRPVFALNIINSGNPWTSWVTVPRSHFGNYAVPQYAVPRLPATTTVTEQTTAPVPAPRAVPRLSSGVSIGDHAVPRSPSRDVAVPRQFGSPPAAGTQPPAFGSRKVAGSSRAAAVRNPRLGVAPRSGLVEDPGPSERAAAVDTSVARPPGAAAGARQPWATPRAPIGSGPLKQPLPDVPLATERTVSPAGRYGSINPRPINPRPIDPRLINRSAPPPSSSWYGQSSPWSGSSDRAAPTMQTPPAATAPAPASSLAVPRWSAPAFNRTAPGAFAAPSLQFSPTAPVMRGPVAVPRGSSAPAVAPSRPAEVPSGGETAPRHAPSSRRPS